MSMSATDPEKIYETACRERYYLNVRLWKSLEEMAHSNPLWLEIFELPSRTEHWLVHGDVETRYIAFRTMALPWRSRDAYIAACRSNLNDSVDLIATLATNGLAEYYQSTGNKEIAYQLGLVLADRAKSLSVRKHCYATLLVIFDIQDHSSILEQIASPPYTEFGTYWDYDEKTFSRSIKWDCVDPDGALREKWIGSRGGD